MANYLPVRPPLNGHATIPSSTAKTMIVAHGGNLLVSTDDTPNFDWAVPLMAGMAIEMKAGVAWHVKCESGVGAEVRRMDV